MNSDYKAYQTYQVNGMLDVYNIRDSTHGCGAFEEWVADHPGWVRVYILRIESFRFKKS